MSKKSEAIASVRGAASAARGSHLTIEARQNIMEKVVEAAYARGQQVTGIQGLGEKHVAQYIRERQEQGIAARTLQNELSAVRRSMEAAGRGQAANSAGMGTRAMGVEAASREGTRAPATLEQVRAAHAAALRMDPGLAATVALQATLGLRRMEAIQANRSLDVWATRIEAGEKRIEVWGGTKGGRRRDVEVIDRAATLAAIREAQAVAADRQGQILSGSLRSAESSHRNAWHRTVGPTSGIESHQLRAHWAKLSVERYEAQGHDHRTALAKTSLDLGHGDRRGRWVERVYLAKA